jgi:hypothetical protein
VGNVRASPVGKPILKAVSKSPVVPFQAHEQGKTAMNGTNRPQSIGTALLVVCLLGTLALGPAAAADQSTDTTTTGDVVSIATTDGTVQVEAAAGQTISGTTELPAGTDLTVRLRSSSTENPFVIPKNATVSDDGNFDVTVNMSRYSPGTTFDVTVLDDGTTIEEADGEIVADASPTTERTTDELPEDGEPTMTETTTETTAAPDTTTGSGPGFGVGLALVSILGVVAGSRYLRR